MKRLLRQFSVFFEFCLTPHTYHSKLHIELDGGGGEELKNVIIKFNKSLENTSCTFTPFNPIEPSHSPIFGLIFQGILSTKTKLVKVHRPVADKERERGGHQQNLFCGIGRPLRLFLATSEFHCFISPFLYSSPKLKITCPARDRPKLVKLVQ